MILIILTILTIISATITIRAEYKNQRNYIYLFKPLSTSLIILIAILQPVEVSSYYRNLIILGLIFSLTGDVFLMLPNDRFLYGLAAFLVTHIFYIFAFSSDSQFPADFILIVPALIAIGIVLKFLLPHTGDKTIPVIIYAIILVLLFWQSAGRLNESFSHSAIMAFIGSVLFIFSDATLVMDRFVKKFGSARLLVLSTYFTSQLLIAFSV